MFSSIVKLLVRRFIEVLNTEAYLISLITNFFLPLLCRQVFLFITSIIVLVTKLTNCPDRRKRLDASDLVHTLGTYRVWAHEGQFRLMEIRIGLVVSRSLSIRSLKMAEGIAGIYILKPALIGSIFVMT